MTDQPDPYAPHDDFIRPAWARSELWRIVVMMIGFEIVFFKAPDVIVAFLPGDAAVQAYYEATTAFGTLAQFFTFGIAAIGLAVLVRVLHGRGVWSLVGPAEVAWVDLRRVAWGVGLALFVIEILPPWINSADLAEIRNLGTWLALIPVAMLALLVQVGTEELYFRGYLQQQFACLSPSRWVWMGLPSFIFGLLHYWNGNGVSDGIMLVIWATLLGLACADLTARTGSIGAAVGLHLSNNAFALLIFGMQGWPSSGLALFLYPHDDPAQYDYSLWALFDPRVVVEMSIMICAVYVMWLAARVMIRR